MAPQNVWFDQSPNSDIRVKFTTVISSTTVNENTFQVYYFDQDANKVYVDGTINQKSESEFAFVPNGDLLDGVRYVAQVWGKTEAQAADRDEWVRNLKGHFAQPGEKMDFLDHAQPAGQAGAGAGARVQAAGGQETHRSADITSAGTRKPMSSRDTQARTVVLDDIKLVWSPQNGAIGEAYWRSGTDEWSPKYDKSAAKRKR